MYSGLDGFLGTRASIMLDVVFVAMFAVLPILAWSIYLVKVRRSYQLHKQVQITVGVVLLAAVTMFEVDMRVSGWRHRAVASPYWASGTVDRALAVHLVFAVTTAVLWIVVMVRALRNYASPPLPGPHSRWHKRWGWIAAIDMALTSLTGWIFYWLAFAAS
jgi:putative membrane protein